MSDRSLPRPARRVPRATAALAALALAAGALATTAVDGVVAPAAAAPVADCAVAYPAADLSSGDVLDGLTVTSGTTPEPFTATVIGVLTDGIAAGVDMIIVKVDPTGLGIDPDEVKGIWQGMSGSPLYAADDRLVGAVSYGLAGYQQSWIAGVTPFADMTGYVGTQGATDAVRLDARTARKVAAAAGVSAARVATGFRQLPMPLGVAGTAGAPRLLNPSAKTLRRHSWLPSDAYALGRAPAALAPGADSIVAGGNVAAAVAVGDVTMAGVGTATSVCDDQVVAFGHPMGFFGNTSLTLHPAEALYVQGDLPSFKVANIGPAVGTVFGDHLTSITGAFGATPKSATVTSTASYGARHRTGTTTVSVREPDPLASATFYSVGANATRVVDAARPGSEVLTWRITGTDARGRAFDLTWTDRYLSTFDVTVDVPMALGDLVYGLASLPGVTIDSITTDGQVTRDTTYYRVARVEQRRGGEWVRLSRSSPALARAGHPLVVRAVLRGAAGSMMLPFTFDVPRKASGKTALLNVVGGASLGLDLGRSLGSARKALADAVRSDTLRVQFGKAEPVYDEGSDLGDGDYRTGPGGGPDLVTFLQERTSTPSPAVLMGVKSLLVAIR